MLSYLNYIVLKNTKKSRGKANQSDRISISVVNIRCTKKDWWILAHPYYLHPIRICVIFHLNECITQNSVGSSETAPAIIFFQKKLMTDYSLSMKKAKGINALLFVHCFYVILGSLNQYKEMSSNAKMCGNY